MGLLSTLREDLDNARSHDPAARGDLENALTYLGVVGETGVPALQHLSIDVYVSSPAPESAAYVTELQPRLTQASTLAARRRRRCI